MLLQNIVSRSIMCGFADTVSQSFEHETISPYRSLSFACYGALSAPILFHSFRVLSSRYKPYKSVVIFESVIWPVTCMPIYFSMQHSSTSSSLFELYKKTNHSLVNEGPKVAISSAMLWIPISYIQFTYCPIWAMTYVRTILCTLYYIGLSSVVHRVTPTSLTPTSLPPHPPIIPP